MGKGSTLKTLIHTEDFVKRIFQRDNDLILDSEKADKLYRCIKIKSSIYLLFLDEPFLSVFFPLNIAYLFIFYHLSHTEGSYLLTGTSAYQTVVCMYFPLISLISFKSCY